VLADEGLSAICKIVLKDREALAALNPYSNTMLLSTLYWPDEIRSTAELDLPDEDFKFKPSEKAMAKQLVAAMRGEFDPANYEDEYRKALEAVIEAKVDGQPVKLPKAEAKPTKIADLMSVLEASVAAARESKAGRGAAAKPAAKKAAAKPAATKPAVKASASKAKAAAEKPKAKRKAA
jgi:DNA end-binding protein Ku